MDFINYRGIGDIVIGYLLPLSFLFILLMQFRQYERRNPISQPILNPFRPSLDNSLCGRWKELLSEFDFKIGDVVESEEFLAGQWAVTNGDPEGVYTFFKIAFVNQADQLVSIEVRRGKDGIFHKKDQGKVWFLDQGKGQIRRLRSLRKEFFLAEAGEP
jgi:hypothetical protein